MSDFSFQPITKKDLEDDHLLVINQAFQQIKESLDYVRGRNGPVVFENGINLGGNELTNVGNQSTGSTLAEQVRADLESNGSSPLTSYRRVNDPTQRENSSAYLGSLPSLVPHANNSNLTITDHHDGTTTAALTAGFVELSASLKSYYPARTDLMSNPAADSYFYYYLRSKDKSVQLDGPYTSDTQVSRLNSNKDGNVMLAKMQILAAGGGTGNAGNQGIL